MEKGRKIRILVAKPALDGHDQWRTSDSPRLP